MSAIESSLGAAHHVYLHDVTVQSMWDSVAPVVTLLLGALIGRGSTRRADRLTAADMIADLDRLLWSKSTGDDDSWINAKAYIGRLSVRLRMGGVPGELVQKLEKEFLKGWNATYDSGDAEVGWVLDNPVAHNLSIYRDAVAAFLHARISVIARIRAKRMLSRLQ